jgi:tetratricopeptide (TPR) repeat protein
LIRRALGSALLIWIASPCLVQADVRDYERGVKLLRESRQQRDLHRREEVLDEAKAAFDVFLRESPEYPSARSARTQIGNILVERARLQSERARSTNAHFEARRLYERAYEVFEKAKTELHAELSELRAVDPAEREKLVRRDRLRAEYLQAQLLMAAVLEESADTYDSHDARRQDVLAKAADEFREIFTKYRSRLAGLYARYFESRCLSKRGKCKEALRCLEDVFHLPDEPGFSTLKTKALNLAMECWLDDSQKDYRQAMDRGDQWLKKYGDQDSESAEGLELRFHLARAHYLFAKSIHDAQLTTSHRETARTLAEFVARREGTLRAQARRLLAKIGDDDAATEAP